MARALLLAANDFAHRWLTDQDSFGWRLKNPANSAAGSPARDLRQTA